MAAFNDLSLLRLLSASWKAAAFRRARGGSKFRSQRSAATCATEENSRAALLRRDTHRMSLTETGHRLLADARAILALAEEAEQRLHEAQAALRGTCGYSQRLIPDNSSLRGSLRAF